MYRKKILYRLKGELKRLGFTQRRLSLLINVPEGRVSNCINGQEVFKKSEVEKICEILKIDPKDFF